MLFRHLVKKISVHYKFWFNLRQHALPFPALVILFRCRFNFYPVSYFFSYSLRFLIYNLSFKLFWFNSYKCFNLVSTIKPSQFLFFFFKKRKLSLVVNKSSFVFKKAKEHLSLITYYLLFTLVYFLKNLFKVSFFQSWIAILDKIGLEFKVVSKFSNTLYPLKV